MSPPVVDGAGREREPVELVDVAGRPVGTATVAQAHAAPGQRHRAFSVLLLTPDERRLLLQRRAGAKSRFPLRWANSCCGHPPPGEEVARAATRRLAEELGVAGVALTEVGVYQYRAPDPGSEWVECEYDHVLIGRISPEQTLRPDPAEVAALRWVDPSELRELLAGESAGYAPWLPGVVQQLGSAVGGPWTD